MFAAILIHYARKVLFYQCVDKDKYSQAPAEKHH